MVAKSEPVSERVRALIVQDGEFLLIHRVKGDLEYYVLPGGGKESNESIEEALYRECREELSVDVNIIHNSEPIDHDGERTYIFKCEILNGDDPVFGSGPEVSTDENQYNLVWRGCDDVKSLDIKPTASIPTILNLITH